MRGREFTATVEGGQVSGWVDGAGPPVLMLHGGPGLSYTYLDDLAPEIGAGYQVASYQQRGIAPSMLDGPYDIDTHVADVAAVLDSLGWPSAYVVGHSWGGHLGFHLAAAIPGRLSGLLAVDPLGAVGDGGETGMGVEMNDRTPADARARAAELDQRALAGEASEADALEGLRLYWPAYFADPASAPPMPPISMCGPAYSECFESIHERLPGLESALPSISLPVGILVGSRSPIPNSAAHDTAAAIPGAWVGVVDGAGHFPWVERPGSVRSALGRLVQG
jgi:pimeloyl-ACP methyl ester carboxylesterase